MLQKQWRQICKKTPIHLSFNACLVWLFCFYIDPQSCVNHCILKGPSWTADFGRTRGVLTIYMRPTADGSVIPWPSPSWAHSAERCFTCTPQHHVSQRGPQTVLRALYLITLSVGSAVWLDVVWLVPRQTSTLQRLHADQRQHRGSWSGSKKWL